MSGTAAIRGGGLYRRLAVPITVFVLVSSLALSGWIVWLHREDSLQRFRATAATNAQFLAGTALPRSPTMAARLSSILGCEVGFFSSGQGLVVAEAAGWPGEIRRRVPSLAGGAPALAVVGGMDVALAPLGDGQSWLVLVRPREGGLAGMAGWVLGPTLVLTLASGALALFLVHRVARPITLLTGWLPHLKDRAAAAEVPPEVSRRRDEIGQLARSLEETHRRLLEEQELRHRSERLATLGRIATSLAHEIRNPAAAIRMHADLLRISEEADRPESLALIGEEVDRITDLVNQWLFVARAQPPEKRVHDLAEMAAGVGRRLAPMLAHAGAVLEVEAGAAPFAVACDRLRLEQVLRNLLVNAVQAMPGGGVVTVSLGRQAEQVVLTVADSGLGFSDEALGRFGEPFFTEREGGMGLGLTLAREVVEAHGGRISALNRPTGGAEVEIVLPEGRPSAPS